jgi:DNA-binding LacI/PurR family transcriptional regulator
MKSLAIITNNQHQVFQRLVIAGARSVAEQQGYRVVIDSFAEDPTAPHSIRVRPVDADGFMCIANAAPVEYVRAVHTAGKPITLVSHRIPELPVPTVVFNNAQGIRELTRHLIEDCGRSRLVFIRGVADQFDAIERERAFRQALMRHNLDLPDAYFIPGDFEPEIAVPSLQAFMAEGYPFDAVLASDYRMAASIVEMLREAGREVPKAISVVGFGDAPEARAAGVTTVAADVEELGQRAARQLIEQVKGLQVTGVTTLSVRLIVRNTSC